MTKKFETSKHNLIAEKNLDQKDCFSTTNGRSEVDHENAKSVFWLTQLFYHIKKPMLYYKIDEKGMRG